MVSWCAFVVFMRDSNLTMANKYIVWIIFMQIIKIEYIKDQSVLEYRLILEAFSSFSYVYL